MSIPSVLAASVSGGSVLLIVIVLFIIFTVTLAILSRLKKCPSDKVMVIFGSELFRNRTGQHAARCLHGGTAFIWPVISFPASDPVGGQSSECPVQTEYPDQCSLRLYGRYQYG